MNTRIELTNYSVAYQRGGREGRGPPLAQNFFIFMQFSGKIDQIIGWRPPSGVSAPSPGAAIDKLYIKGMTRNDLLSHQSPV